MNNKTVVGVLVIFFFLAVFADAKGKQEQAQQQLSADDIAAKLKVQLDLTDKQVDKVKLIIENYLAKEQQLKLEEKKQMSRVLTGGQMYSWEDLQRQEQKAKKKHAGL